MKLSAVWRATSAEMLKLAGLPSIALTVAGTIVLTVGLSALLALAAPDGTGAVQVIAQTITFSQAGAILLGILIVAQEYAGRHLATSVIAVPHRSSIVIGKVLVYTGTAVVMNGLAVALSIPAVLTVQSLRDDVQVPAALEVEHLSGMVLYLVLIGLLAIGLTFTLRSLIAPLVALLATVLVVSPLMANVTEHARWLPDRAGMLLFQPSNDTVLSPLGGAAVLTGWVVLTLAMGTLSFLRRDASVP